MPRPTGRDELLELARSEGDDLRGTLRLLVLRRYARRRVADELAGLMEGALSDPPASSQRPADAPVEPHEPRRLQASR